jgi:membrane-associated phospholipid phosphatase
VPGHSLQTYIVTAVQSWSPPGGEQLAHLFSALGNESFYLVLMPCLLFFAPWGTAVRAARALVWTDLASEWIKWTLQWPRPEAAVALAKEPSPGFVSSHASLSLAVALVLAKDHPKLRPWLALWVVGVGWSRLRLGVHFPLDILGGWLLGCLIAALVLRLGEDSRRASYLSVAYGLIFLLLWPQVGVESLQRDLGMLFGLEIGLMQRLRGEPSFPAPPRLRPIWGLFRLALMLVAYLGLKALDWPRLLRYLVLALLVSWRAREASKKIP